MPLSPALLTLFLSSALLLPAASATPDTPEKIPVLVVGGANNHDWSWTTPSLVEILEESGKFEVTVTETPAETLADPATYQKYRALVLDYNGPRWGKRPRSSSSRGSRPAPGSSSTTPRTTPSRGGRSTRRWSP